ARGLADPRDAARHDVRRAPHRRPREPRDRYPRPSRRAPRGIRADRRTHPMSTDSLPPLSTIDEAVEALRAGRPVIVADDADRENEGDLILSAELASPAKVGWMVRYTSGYLCAPMPAEWADRLELPPMVA